MVRGYLCTVRAATELRSETHRGKSARIPPMWTFKNHIHVLNDFRFYRAHRCQVLGVAGTPTAHPTWQVTSLCATQLCPLPPTPSPAGTDASHCLRGYPRLNVTFRS